MIGELCDLPCVFVITPIPLDAPSHRHTRCSALSHATPNVTRSPFPMDMRRLDPMLRRPVRAELRLEGGGGAVLDLCDMTVREL